MAQNIKIAGAIYPNVPAITLTTDEDKLVTYIDSAEASTTPTKTWTRPSEWPDLFDKLDDWNWDNYEGIWLLYDTSLNENGSIALNCVMRTTSHQFGVYVYNYDYEEEGWDCVYNEDRTSSNNLVASAFRKPFSEVTEYSKWVLVEIVPATVNGHINYMLFAPQDAANTSNGTGFSVTDQACIERVTRLPWSAGQPASTAYTHSSRSMVHEYWKDWRMNYTSNVSMAYMFGHQNKLECVEFDNFPQRTTTWANTFFQCISLYDIRSDKPLISSSSTVISNTFYNCHNLREIATLEDWDVSNLATLTSAFYGCNNLSKIPMGKWNLAKVTGSIASMFYNCYSITELDFSGWTGASAGGITNTSSMFYNCYSLQKLDISNFNFANITTMVSMFTYCKSLKDVIFPTREDWLPNANDKMNQQTANNGNGLYQLFYYCSTLKNIDISSWPLSVKTRCIYLMFAYCFCLEEVKLPLIDGTALAASANNNNTFTQCYNLKRIEVPQLCFGNFSINACQSLTYESLRTIIEALPQTSTKYTITMGAIIKARLTADDLAEITAKGWAVA